MVGTRRSFFVGTLDYIPSYEVHKELTSQRHMKALIALFERLLGKYGSVVLYGAAMGYRIHTNPTLTEVQEDVRAWIRALKDKDTGKRIVGVSVTIEEGHAHRNLHAHVMVFCKDLMVREEQMWDMQELWEGVATQGDGWYQNDNYRSEDIEKHGGVGSLGYVSEGDYRKIAMVLDKIAYNTKDGYRPEESKDTKKKCFICEEYE